MVSFIMVLFLTIITSFIMNFIYIRYLSRCDECHRRTVRDTIRRGTDTHCRDVSGTDALADFLATPPATR